ncbi:isocitrate lyase/phosphoenolpyruvate mutase family protein [Hymenobacter aquaticus]|uniref:Isocitrate lyase/phosphoenolpyruvate mutase family protein n=1 Tax=Hymenobacter aquaticus TaxID=1867101 RepID=A0A4Z0Q3B4_9BACT|nr:isocitrate lyase/phosphoenolpyruvate mutase family protein [Hymenobacter aquaticus]TGE24510.1 isocitrate lyase/phosphoenolpyruvate mutase family protein [Hymenobacter aquaticus]
MQTTAYHHFRQLHYQPAPLLLPTIWDARSAAASQALGFAAVGTSSAAVASVLGYADGEQLPFAELRYLVSRICASTTLPVSVDVEGGYSRDPARIADHIAELAALGVVGVNLEDSVDERGARRQLPAAEFAATLRTVRARLQAHGLRVFLNVRTDTYLLGAEAPLAATLTRLAQYEAAGADGLFVPGLTDLAQTRDLCRATALPVNVMALPALPDFGALAAAGVRRISMGNFLFEALATRQQQLSRQIQHDHAFTSLFA